MSMAEILDDPLLTAEYRQAPGVYDEMCVAPGILRPHWDRYIASLTSLGGKELAHRWQTARQRIRENGVSYNVYGDPLGTDRPWSLDAIPLLIPPAEWAYLEAGLIQRARLLNTILADLYGPQKLLLNGNLPSALVFANPAFWRACHDVPVPRSNYLHLLAVDLARSPDGQWWVISDRTQAPSGAGYALENRIVMAETFPDLFREAQVHRLASFFRDFRETLLHLSPSPRTHPRVVLLTPGPLNETYFEHSYLARYLGFTLVQGSDLTVRENRVFLKSLEGLRPVDVILRRMDDGFCDPLELRSDSYLGVPGLVEAVRSWQCSRSQCVGQRAARNLRIYSLSSGPQPQPARRAPGAPLRRYLVVWPAPGSPLCAPEPGFSDHQTRFPGHGNGARLRRQARAYRTLAAAGAVGGAAERFCRTGAAQSVQRPCLVGKRPDAAARSIAGLYRGRR